jgi:hypothetical protein
VKEAAPAGALVETLVDALSSERRLLEALITLVQHQRLFVGSGDLQGMTDGVYATHRVLVTLGEARRRRRTLNCLLGGSEDLGIQGLEQLLGARMTDSLQRARISLQATVRVLAREVEITRRVLRDAREARRY